MKTSLAEFLVRKSNEVFIKMNSHRKGKFKVNSLYSLVRPFPYKQHLSPSLKRSIRHSKIYFNVIPINQALKNIVWLEEIINKKAK